MLVLGSFLKLSLRSVEFGRVYVVEFIRSIWGRWGGGGGRRGWRFSQSWCECEVALRSGFWRGGIGSLCIRDACDELQCRLICAVWELP